MTQEASRIAVARTSSLNTCMTSNKTFSRLVRPSATLGSGSGQGGGCA
ncbi:hypothetical protein [Streptomyces sp. R33]